MDNVDVILNRVKFLQMRIEEANFIDSRFESAQIVDKIIDYIPLRWWEIFPLIGSKRWNARRKLYRVFSYLSKNAHEEYRMWKDNQ